MCDEGFGRALELGGDGGDVFFEFGVVPFCIADVREGIEGVGELGSVR